MEITGIICEYNPFHMGHKKQIDAIRAEKGVESGIVCLMSGNFVQRGAPAIVDKTARAKVAVLCGADLVLELPVTAALASAEGFAAKGVAILAPFCDSLCFGAENADIGALMTAARALLSVDFPVLLREQLKTGVSFPIARQAALERLGVSSNLLTQPNNILAVEYCKAILSQGASLDPFPVPREGAYHATQADSENPSATAVRVLMEDQGNWQSFVPERGRAVFEGVPLHIRSAGERAVLSRLRTMTDGEFEALPYGSEGLWRKLMHAVRQEASLEEVIAAAKSKRYTRTRLDRMVMCAFLGLTAEDFRKSIPYVRVLAFNNRGRKILTKARMTGRFPNAGETIEHPYQRLESRCGDLYGLFAAAVPDPPGAEARRRVFYHTGE